jgi:hypothetical protein
MSISALGVAISFQGERVLPIFIGRGAPTKSGTWIPGGAFVGRADQGAL